MAYEGLYSQLNDEWQKELKSRRYEVLFGNNAFTVDGLWLCSKIYTCFVDSWINILGGRKILEVGSGRGDNLVKLLQNNPDYSFTGIERSPQGVARSREGNKNITFIEGDALKLPFEDNTFDIAFTIQVLEQIPIKQTAKAVLEMALVAKYGIFIEQFREAQSVADLAWLRYKDYFRDSYKNFNMEPIYFTKDVPHKLKYSLGLYVGKFK